jgi:CBS-domain-containing membrane protein
VFEMTHEFAMVQDGHLIHHIHPPTDLQSWRSLPVGALANPNPVSLEWGKEHSWKGMIDRYPFRVFPVVAEGVPQGVVTRRSLVDWKAGEPAPAAEPVVTCHPEDLLGIVEARFLETPAGLILLVDHENKLCGLLTLHDLIRAQATSRD